LQHPFNPINYFCSLNALNLCLKCASLHSAQEFADWVCSIHHHPVHVVYTNDRPVPLQHYVFPGGGDGLHLVVDEKGRFREDNFQRAMSGLQSQEGEGGVGVGGGERGGLNGNGGGGGRNKKTNKPGQKGAPTDLHRIVNLCITRGLNPVIIFSFSKKDCEKFAVELSKEVSELVWFGLDWIELK